MYLKAGDIISGREGWATANIDGEIKNMFYIKQFEATFEKNKNEVNVLDHRSTQHKTVGWTGTGSMTIYYITTDFRKLAQRFAREGIDTYFTITVKNEDPTSTVGRQTVALYDVNLDSAVIAKLDVDNTELDEDVDFTFEDFEILDSFVEPVLGG